MKKNKEKLTDEQAIKAHKEILKKNVKLYPQNSPEKSSLDSKVSSVVDKKEGKKSKTIDKSKSKNAKNNHSNKNKKTPNKNITKAKANKIIKDKISELLAERSYNGYSESSLISIAKAKFLHGLGKISDDELAGIRQAYEP